MICEGIFNQPTPPPIYGHDKTEIKIIVEIDFSKHTVYQWSQTMIL